MTDCRDCANRVSFSHALRCEEKGSLGAVDLVNHIYLIVWNGLKLLDFDKKSLTKTCVDIRD